MPVRSGSPRLALAWLILSEARAHPARGLLTALAIAVGVALGFGVHLVNHSALSSFDDAMHSVNGAADLRVQAVTPLGFDEMTYPRVAMLRGITDASPVVVLPATANGARMSLLGIDILRAAAVTPALLARPAALGARSDSSLGGSIYLSSTALALSHSRIGDVVTMRANGRTVMLPVAGTVPGIDEGQSVAVMDIAAAQWRFGRFGRIDRIDLKLGEDVSVIRSRLSAILPADAMIANEASESARGDAMSRAYRVNLDMLALVALLTGGFLVYSAQSLSVARRLRTFALIRTLGMPQGGVVATVAIEGLLIGLVGAIIGLFAGYGLAAVALARFGGTLGTDFFGTGTVRLAFAPWSAAGFLALGLAAAIAGSVLPALSAARAAPAIALRNMGDVVDPRSPVPWRPAATLLLLGGLAALLPAVGGLPLFGFIAIGLMLAGGIAIVPWLARHLLAPFAVRGTRHVPLQLAMRHLHGAPGHAATALCGIVASTALMIAMAVMVTSFRTAVDDWLGDVLSADLYMRIEGGIGFDRTTQSRMKAVPGVADMGFMRQIAVTMAPDRPPLSLIARTVRIRPPHRNMMLLAEADRLPTGAVPVWVSEPAARIYGWRPGDRIALPIGKGAAFAVAGIWRDYARQQGSVTIDGGDYDRLTGDTGRNLAAITLTQGAPPGLVAAAIAAQIPPALQGIVGMSDSRQLRQQALAIFDRSFAVTYVLEGVAILVGLIGVGATMSAQTIARSREFGMLRHIGVTKAQIIAMLASEGALLGLIGGIVGVGLGAIMAQVLIHVVNPQSFNWTMTTRWPFATIAGVIVALVVAAAGTAILSGRRAIAADAVRAVREDW